MTRLARGVAPSRLGSVSAGRAGRAELWYVLVGDDTRRDDTLLDTLSDVEQRRAASYRNRAAAHRYVLTRALVRAVLGTETASDPRDVSIARTAAGKPYLSRSPNGAGAHVRDVALHFNVSHSHDLVVVGTSNDAEIGVDVEQRRTIKNVDALVRRWLTPDERRAFDHLRANVDDVSHAFLQVWSAKEARLKALGVGISGAIGAAAANVLVSPIEHLLDTIVSEHRYVGSVAFVTPAYANHGR